MIKISALLLTAATALACQQPPPPAPQAAPAPPPPPPAMVAAAPTPPPAPGSDTRSLAQAFAGAAHLTVTVTTLKPGGSERSTKKLDDQIPAVLAALGPDQRPAPAMPRCMTPVELSFSDAANNPLGSVGFCDTGAPKEVIRQQGRVDFANPHTMGGFTAANPDALAKFLP